ncbi:hypothetical protein F4678DRAFT_435723 [Xylaria arbuscula]|nr:hypothetical protein F4678DRAFT_435723 [Xylaria arbuscula]
MCCLNCLSRVALLLPCLVLSGWCGGSADKKNMPSRWDPDGWTVLETPFTIFTGAAARPVALSGQPGAPRYSTSSFRRLVFQRRLAVCI